MCSYCAGQIGPAARRETPNLLHKKKSVQIFFCEQGELTNECIVHEPIAKTEMTLAVELDSPLSSIKDLLRPRCDVLNNRNAKDGISMVMPYLNVSTVHTFIPSDYTYCT